jgi:7-cyano-7-deazaguanine synthase
VLEKKAVVLLSGGLDSATTLAIAAQRDFACYALTCLYGQRHRIEIEAAKNVATSLGAQEHKILSLDLKALGGSALTDATLRVPKSGNVADMEPGIPVTYVPARNTILLSLALAWAEVIGSYDLFIGVNALDYSGYPDCREEFIRAFESTANLATAAAVEGRGRFRVHAPIIHLTKAQVIEQGITLGVDYRLTHSCYDPDDRGTSCGRCDACLLRLKGFSEAGVADPIRYQGGGD